MQYMQEQQQRTKPLQKKQKHIKTVVRIRPFNHKQKQRNQKKCIQVQPNNILLIKGRHNTIHQFKADYIFDQKSKQQQIYQSTMTPLIQGVFQGYNATVLAYGQTGSGKTYTMGTVQNNNQQDIGILPRAIKHIFQQVQARSNSKIIDVKITFIQLYNKSIYDLLGRKQQNNQKNNIKLYANDQQTILIGVKQIPVFNSQQAISQLYHGIKLRTTSSTNMNQGSSRSHAIYTMQIQQRNINHPQKIISVSKFYFVDLAGSQKVSKSGTQGQSMQQGININVGLLQLGRLIQYLAKNNKNKGNFINYRNSDLNLILKNSLLGNSNTMIITCVSPAEINQQQSLSTLRFAQNAMSIKIKPKINRGITKQDMLRQQIRKLKKIIKDNGLRQVQSQVGYSQKNNPALYKWDLRMSNKLIWSGQNGTDILDSFKYNDDLYFAGKGRRVKKMNIQTNQVKIYTPLHSYQINCLLIKNQNLYTCSNQTVKIWNLDQKNVTNLFTTHLKDKINLIKSNQNQQIFIANQNGNLNIFNHQQNIFSLQNNFKPHKGNISSLQFLQNNCFITSSNDQQIIKIWKRK